MSRAGGEGPLGIPHSTVTAHGTLNAQAMFRAGPATSTVWAEWDGVYIVYHRPSGKTHVLNVPSELLLHQVLVDGSTIDEAAMALAALLETEPDEPFRHQVHDTMLELESLGLLVRS